MRVPLHFTEELDNAFLYRHVFLICNAPRPLQYILGFKGPTTVILENTIELVPLGKLKKQFMYLSKGAHMESILCHLLGAREKKAVFIKYAQP